MIVGMQTRGGAVGCPPAEDGAPPTAGPDPHTYPREAESDTR